MVGTIASPKALSEPRQDSQPRYTLQMSPEPQSHGDWLRDEVGSAAKKVGVIDWLMLVLAVVSVGLLVWETLADPAPEISRMIFTADYVICGIFALEFLWRWAKAGWTLAHVKRNWYEILGMIPFQHPAVRGFRLFRVIRIVILLARFGRAADRALGDEFTYRLVSRFKNAIVESISATVTVAMIDEVKAVMAKGRFAENIGRALQENEVELREMIGEKLREDRQAGRLSKLPFAREISETVIDTSIRIIDQVLQDPRTDELISDMLRENLDQIQDAVRERSNASHSRP